MYSRCLRLILLGRSDLSDLRLRLEQLIFVSNDDRASQALIEDRVLQASQENQHRSIDSANSIVTMQQTSSTPTEANAQTAHSSTTGINSPPDSEQNTQEVQLALSLQYPRGSRSSCSNWCSCACHIRRSRSVLSTLFVGYSGLPFFTASCDQKACRRRSRSSMRFTFYFPSWFLARAVKANAAYSSHSGPEFLLRVPKIIPPRSDIFHFAETGNLQGIQDLFERGLASIYDLDMSGSTILHFALNTSQYPVCKLLLDEGADPETEGPQDRRPVDIVWDTILAKYETGERASHIASLFRNDDHIESRGFSLLHKCVLEVLPLNLEQLLTASTAGIDDVDADGRTSLMWAVIRGDEKNLELLLNFGADPSICDKLRKAPLHHARNAACTRLLLSARNNLGQRDAYGRTALHAACRRQGDKERALELLQAGTDVNVVDNWNRTPLSYLAQYDGAETARLLFEERGAEVDVDIADVDGYPPDLTSVEANSHQILAVLLDRISDQSLLRRTRSNANLLHVAIRSADTDTLLTLANHPLSDVFAASDLAHTDADNRTVFDIREQRTSMGTALESAVNTLISRVQSRPPTSSNLTA